MEDDVVEINKKYDSFYNRIQIQYYVRPKADEQTA